MARSDGRMTEPPSTALLAKIVLPDRVLAPAGHVVVSRAPGEDRSGAARLDLYPQERGDADEIYSRLTNLALAGNPPVRVVLTDGAAFEGPLRDVAVQQGLHGVSFTVELMPCRTSGPDPSAVAEAPGDTAYRHLAEALRPFVALWAAFVALWAASDADADEETLEGGGRSGRFPGGDAVRIGQLRALVEAASEAGLVEVAARDRLAASRPLPGTAPAAPTGEGRPVTPAATPVATPAAETPVPAAGLAGSGARRRSVAPGGEWATMATTLAFRTPPGAVSVPAGTSKQLGSVDVRAYERIRVVAAERTGSGNGARVRLTLTEGTELIAPLDVLTVGPMSQITRVYEVPGTVLTIFADALPGTGRDAVDVLVYGWS